MRKCIGYILGHVFFFISSSLVLATPLNDRINETVQLGSSFGLEIDTNTAFAQKPYLGSIFRKEFQRYKDLVPARITEFVESQPNEFWAANKYFESLYINNYISINELLQYRLATVAGLRQYLDKPTRQIETASEIVESQNRDQVSDTPELDRFIEIVQTISSGRSIEESVERKLKNEIDEVTISESRSYLNERFKSARLRGSLFSNDNEPEFTLGLVSSLTETPTDNLFNQIDISNQNNNNSVSLGLGYRVQPNNESFVGVNAFVDHRFQTDHNRGSIGIELANPWIFINGNRYFPLSNYRTVSQHEAQRPASGYDLYVDFSSPDSPIAVTYRTEYWDKTDLGFDRLHAYGLKGEISDSLSVTVESIDSTHSDPVTSGNLTYIYRFDQGNIEQSLPPPSFFATQRYKFVERDRTMPLATKITNRPPIAEDKSGSISSGGTISFAIAELVMDPDDDPLTITIITEPNYGSVSVQNNQIIYTHSGNDLITDSFKYSAQDDYGGSDDGVISIQINDVIPPTVTINASEVDSGDTTDDEFITVTFETSKTTSDFTVDDVIVTNATLSDFSGSDTSYTAILSPVSQGVVTVNIDANQFTDTNSNQNLAADEFNWTFETTCPTGLASFNGGFETGLDGWAVMMERIVLGQTEIAGVVAPIDPTPNGILLDDGTLEAYIDPNDIGSEVRTTSRSSDGQQAMYVTGRWDMPESSRVDVDYKGPAVYSPSIPLRKGNVISFDWAYWTADDDIFAYYINETTGNIEIVLDSPTYSDDFQTHSFTVPESGQYRIVFVLGLNHDSGINALGRIATVVLDNFVCNTETSGLNVVFDGL